MTATARTAVYVGNVGTRDISVLRLDPARGALEPLDRIPIPDVSGEVSSTPMALGGGGRFLYVGVRAEPFVVASFAIDPASGALRHLGNGPLAANLAYLSVDPAGRHLFGASYAGSTVTVNPIDPDGRMLPATFVRETGAHAHCAVLAPDGRHLLVTSLGADRIHRYGWEPEGGRLSQQPIDDIVVAAGAGPRHIVFHPDGRVAYLLNERNGTVQVVADEEGTLTALETLSIMPKGGQTTPWAADIHVTPDGRFLYASERASHTISAVAIGPDGRELRLVETIATETEPRGFNIDPSGSCVLVAGQTSDHVACYRIDRATGALTLAARHRVGRNPNWIEMVALNAD